MQNLKNQLQHEINKLSYLIGLNMYQIFKTILSISSKNLKQLLIILQEEYM